MAPRHVRRHGACHLQDPIMGARRPLEALSGGFKQDFSRVVGPAKMVNVAATERLVAAILPRQLPLACERDPLGNDGTAFKVARARL